VTKLRDKTVPLTERDNCQIFLSKPLCFNYSLLWRAAGIAFSYTILGIAYEGGVSATVLYAPVAVCVRPAATSSICLLPPWYWFAADHRLGSLYAPRFYHILSQTPILSLTLYWYQ